MEKNTVLLEVGRYNELYNLEKAINEGKTKVVQKIFDYSVRSEYIYYYSENEIIDSLTKEVEDFHKEVKHLESQLEKTTKKLEIAENKLPKPNKQFTLDEVRKMNYWQFRKWRADNK